jgi:hypothetical protein
MKHRKSVLIPLVIILLSACPIRAQWKVIATFPMSDPSFVSTPYFINENVGFLYTTGEVYADATSMPSFAIVKTKLIKTTDGGVTWTKTNFPLVAGSITSLYFTSLQTGYALIWDAGNVNPGAVWKSVDGGINWVNCVASRVLDEYDIYSTGRRVFVPGGSMSPDGGSTWDSLGQFNGQIVGEWVSGNLAENVAIAEGGPGGGIWYSSDTGSSWQFASLPYTLANGVWGICAFAHTPNYFAGILEWPGPGGPGTQGTYDTAAVILSTDAGKSWNMVLGFGKQYHLTGIVGAAGCTVYAQHSIIEQYPLPSDTGFVRSTDLGKTWVSVGGPSSSFAGSVVFSVVGRGAVVYSTDWQGNLWKATKGGDDGALSSSMIHQTTISKSSKQFSHDTIYTSLCDSTSFNVYAGYLACDATTLDSLALSSSATPYNAYLTHSLIKSGGSDTARIVFHPTKAGVFPMSIRATFLREDWLTEDTTFDQFTLVVKDNPAILSVSRKDTIDFGSQTLCTAKLRADSLNIRDLGCEAMQVDSIWMQSGQPGNDFSFAPVKGYTVNNGDSTKNYRVSFKPTQAELETALIFIRTSAGTDTLYLKGAGLANSLSIVLAVDSIASQVCDSSNGLLTITNASCNLMTLDSILLPQPMYLLPNQLPLGLPSGDSQQVSVRFVPISPGSDTVTFRAVLRSISNGDTTTFDTVLKLVASARPGNPAVSIADTTINFGAVSICSNATLPAFFMSTGCDSLRVSGEVLSAGVLSSGFSVLNAHSGSLGVGAKDSVLVKFVPPGVKQFYDTLWVTTNAGVRKVYVSGQGTADPGKIVLSDTSLAFGTLTASCDSSARVFRFVNSTCNSISVDSIGVRVTDGTSVPRFQIVGTASGTLAPRDSESFALSFVPGVAGAYSGVVTVYYHGIDNVEHDTSIALSGVAVAAPTIGVTMKPGSYSASALGIIDIPLYLTGSFDQASSQSIGLQTLDIVLAMNTDLLTPLSANSTIPNIPPIPVQIMGKNSVTLPVTLPANFTFSDSTELLTLHCQAFITVTMQTVIGLQSAVFVAKSASACFTQSPANGTNTFSLIARCEDSVLTGDLAHGLAFTIQSVIPNPTDGKLTVVLVNSAQVTIRYEIYDALGHSVAVGTFAAGPNTIDMQRLPSGVYYLRAASPGRVESRRIVLRR